MSAAILRFPGIRQVVSASYTLAHGITPGVCSVECAPQFEPIQSTGAMTWEWENVSFTFQDCRAVFGTASRGPDGLTWSIQIQDRRWKWAFGCVYGEYNRRDDSQQILPLGSAQPGSQSAIQGIKKSAYELAVILLQAMGEQGFDASVMPGDVYPHVEWTPSNPAKELASLCDLCGKRICLNFDGTVSIVTPGLGAFLPNGRVTESSLILDPPERPDSIEVVGQPIRIQTRLPLSAVGEDTNGKLVPIDELSYKPANGWSKEGDMFNGVIDKSTREKLAFKTVFKYYRIGTAGSGGQIYVRNPGILPPWFQINSLAQILPISDQLVETYFDHDAGEYRRKKATIRGIYNKLLSYKHSRDNSSTTSWNEYKGSFTIDADRGLVKFSDPVWMWSEVARGRVEADITLECSFNARVQYPASPAPGTPGPAATIGPGHFLTWAYNVPANGPRFGTGPEIVQSDDLLYEVFEAFNTEGSSIGWFENTPKYRLDDLSKVLAANALAKYQLQSPADATYAGFVPVGPDGAIVSVTWTLDPRPFTHISRNTETEHRVPKYGTRRFYEILQGVAAGQKAGRVVRKNPKLGGGTVPVQ